MFVIFCSSWIYFVEKDVSNQEREIESQGIALKQV